MIRRGDIAMFEFLPALHNKLCKRWYSQRRDVRLSVCHTPVLYQKRSDFFIIEEPDHSSL